MGQALAPNDLKSQKKVVKSKNVCRDLISEGMKGNGKEKKKGKNLKKSGRAGAGVGVSSYISYRCDETKCRHRPQTTTTNKK